MQNSKTSGKAINAFGSIIKAEKGFFPDFVEPIRGGPISGSNQQF